MAQYAENRKAKFHYEFIETYEAGISLLGFEVKAIRAGKISLEGAHVIVRGDEAYLIGANIDPIQPKNVPKEYESNRNRKLLLDKKEIAKLGELEKKKGLTIIPISVYNKGNNLKVSIVVARGKKQFDKRETIKRREANIEAQRLLKDR